MAGTYTTVRHGLLDDIIGYIYTDQNAVYVGLSLENDPGQVLEWYPATDYAEAEHLIQEMLDACVRRKHEMLLEEQEQERAQAAAAQQQQHVPQYGYPPQPYPQTQYPQQYGYPQQPQQAYPQTVYPTAQPQQPQQAYPQPQYAPQPYVMTPADREKAARKAQRKAVRAEVIDQYREHRRDNRDRKRLEKACLRYPCPECSSKEWVKCVSIHGRNTLPAPHISRIAQYEGQQRRW